MIHFWIFGAKPIAAIKQQLRRTLVLNNTVQRATIGLMIISGIPFVLTKKSSFNSNKRATFPLYPFFILRPFGLLGQILGL